MATPPRRQYPITRTLLTLPEAQYLLDNIFPPLSIYSSQHPGRIHEIHELARGSTNTCYLLQFHPNNNELGKPTRLVLKVSSPPTVRLLRYEMPKPPGLQLMDVERKVLEMIHQTVEQDREITRRNDVKESEGGDTDNEWTEIPAVMGYDASRKVLDSAVLLLTYLPGVPLSKARERWCETDSGKELAGRVDIQIGRLIRKINDIRIPRGWTDADGAPRGLSGGASTWEARVGGSHPPHKWGLLATPPANLHSTPGGWYKSHVEGLLRDGEDMRLLLPYAEVRQVMEKWSGWLDPSPHPPNGKPMDDAPDDDGDILTTPPQSPKLCILDINDNSILVNDLTGEIHGIVDFERAVWGDPMCQEMICLGRDGIRLGYSSSAVRKAIACSSEMEGNGYGDSSSSGGNQNGKRIRELLYTILHSLTKILNSYYRQLPPDLCEEMGERKRLVRVIGELEALRGLGGLEVEPNGSGSRSGGEGETQKPAGGEDTKKAKRSSFLRTVLSF